MQVKYLEVIQHQEHQVLLQYKHFKCHWNCHRNRNIKFMNKFNRKIIKIRIYLEL
jgi:hypothetical protein